MSTVKKSVELFFQEGNSDKMYHARIVEIAPGKHDVLVAWGRRGASLNQGKKAVGVSLEAAEKTFAKLVREKTGKGYRAMTAAVQPADVAPPEGQGSGSKVTGKRAKVGRAAQLLNAIEEDELQRFLGDDEMIAQQKLDGVRVLVHVHEEIFATNRSGQVTAAGKDLLESFEHLPRGTVVDGEIIAHEGTFTYWLFDLLSIGDEDITSRGYEHRWERLEEEIEPGLVGNVAVLPIVRGKKHKTKLYESLMGARAEGIVFKHKNAPYVPGRPSSGGSQLKHIGGGSGAGAERHGLAVVTATIIATASCFPHCIISSPSSCLHLCWTDPYLPDPRLSSSGNHRPIVVTPLRFLSPV